MLELFGHEKPTEGDKTALNSNGIEIRKKTTRRKMRT
jgi:hypothetical protein